MTPHNFANDASLRSRSRLSTDGHQQDHAASVRTDSAQLEQFGTRPVHQRLEFRVEAGELVAERVDPTGKFASHDFVAVAGVAASLTRIREHTSTRSLRFRPRSRSREHLAVPSNTTSGARCNAFTRPCIAERRTTRSARIASTSPSRDFGTADAVPFNAARAAASASIVSDFPRRRRS